MEAQKKLSATAFRQLSRLAALKRFLSKHRFKLIASAGIAVLAIGLALFVFIVRH